MKSQDMVRSSEEKNAPVGLGGNLRDFGVAEVLQLVGQQRKSGILEVKRKHQPSLRLVFDEGRVVLATPVGKREFEPLGEMLVRSGFFAQKQLDRMWKQCEERVQSLLAGHPRLDGQRRLLLLHDPLGFRDVPRGEAVMNSSSAGSA